MKPYSKLRLTALSVLCLYFAMPVSAGCEGAFTVDIANGRQIALQFYNDNIVKVTNLSPGEIPVATPAAAFLPGHFNGTADNASSETFTVTTPQGLRVVVDRNDGMISLGNKEGFGIIDMGTGREADGEQTISLLTRGSGSFYGAGERGYSLNLKGDTLVMYNKQNYGYVAGEPRIRQMGVSMPLFISSDGYAVVFDDYAPATMTMTNPVSYTTEATAPISYYFVTGNGSIETTVSELSALTGRQALPPFWTLGYITSKYGYRTQAETIGVVDTLKNAGYPVDGVVLDLYWYGKEQDMGRLAWDQGQWPDHRKMLSTLKKKGVNTVIISQPYILRNGRGIDNYDELARGGMLVKDSLGNPLDVTIWVGQGGMFDVSNPDTRSWLAERYMKLTDEGVSGWWGDLGEPEVHPEAGRHANGLSARQYHNLYGNDWSKIIYELFKQKYPDKRLMTMMRAGTTGLQRYSVFPWSTDVSRSWGGLRPQITIMLNSGLSGLGYMSHDVGGFAIDPDSPVDPELYVRWLQLGTFSPVLRTHSQQVAEPYHYKGQQDIILPLVKERYRWLPYNYTLAWENTSRGLPLVRPINFYDPVGLKTTLDVDDQYLWGRDVMVAPVLERGAKSRRVVMPRSGLWIDYNNPLEVYRAGDVIDYTAPLEILPIFVRAGAFIPQADYNMSGTRDYRSDRYTVKYFPAEGVTSSFTMFDDDRKSATSVDTGKYQLITFKGDDVSGNITIRVSAEGSYPGAPSKRKFDFIIYNVDKPSRMTIDGKKAAEWNYDAMSRTLSFTVAWKTSRPLAIDIVH